MKICKVCKTCICGAQFNFQSKEAFMRLARIISASRRQVTAEIKKPAVLNVHSVAALAIKGCERLVHHRDQTISATPQTMRTSTLMSQPRLLDLISDCIGEISSLALRHTDLVLSMKSGSICIEGSNPIYLPDDALTLPTLVRMRCLVLGITPTLAWGQGVGPILTLVLPLSIHQKTGIFKRGQKQPAGSGHAPDCK
jgi:hypothetical protein